jgi:hypothetical protein
MAADFVLHVVHLLQACGVCRDALPGMTESRNGSRGATGCAAHVIYLKGGITSDALEPGLDADEHRCVDRWALKENCSGRPQPTPVLRKSFPQAAEKNLLSVSEVATVVAGLPKEAGEFSAGLAFIRD